MIKSRDGIIGFAAIIYGLDSINGNWKNSLQKFEYIEEICEKFDEELRKK